MKWVGVGFGLLSVVMLWQHMRYVRARRQAMRDLQPILHSPGAFHVAIYLDVPDGEDVVKAVSGLRGVVEAGGAAKMVYAGQAAFMIPSKQIRETPWDAAVLVQYPSRKAYDEAAAGGAHRDALGAFAGSHSHGLQRGPLFNILLHQILGVFALTDLVRGNFTVPALDPAPASEFPSDMIDERDARIGDLHRLAAINDDAVVVFNLIKPGDADQRKADAAYGRAMVTRMARLGHGPMHFGKAVTLEGDAKFEDHILAYYPGASYFAKLVGSRFFAGIIGGKQLGDTQALPTVPILDRL